MQSDLIYDVGLHHGDDSAYYLSKGYRVVAIEANPRLVEMCKDRFAAEINARRLHILNVGVGPVDGEFTFWLHRIHDEWSSFIRNPSWRDDECEPMTVKCVPFRTILEQFSTPYYLKSDIEGADTCVIQALSVEHRPRYVSFEGGPDALPNLCHLAMLGYTAFKCIDQTTHNAPYVALAVNNEDGWNRRRRQLTLWKWQVTRTFRLDQTWLAAKWRSLGNRKADVAVPNEQGVRWRFPDGSSGPFGEETPGAWQTLDEVIYNWLHRRFGRIDRGTLRREAWYDFHARLELPGDNHHSHPFQRQPSLPI